MIKKIRDFSICCFENFNIPKEKIENFTFVVPLDLDNHHLQDNIEKIGDDNILVQIKFVEYYHYFDYKIKFTKTFYQETSGQSGFDKETIYKDDFKIESSYIYVIVNKELFYYLN